MRHVFPQAIIRRRRGAIVVLAAFLMSFMMMFLALALDAGYLYVARTEAQASADAAALAAAWEMVSDEALLGERETAYSQARGEALDYASRNYIARVSPEVDPNHANETSGDVVIGRLENPSNNSEALSLVDSDRYNAVQVRVQRTSERNGPVPLFFARIFGHDSAGISATATAVFYDNVVGFRADETTGENPSLMPFALDVTKWQELVAGNGNYTDQWSYDSETGAISSESDGLREIKLFPEKGGGGNGNGGNGNGNGGNGNGNGNGNGGGGSGGGGITPGNFGTVDVGNPNNAAPDLWRQIREGPNASDLEWHDGEIRLDPVTEKLELNGDTGITASMKDALADIVGEPRTIFLYESVYGQGNNTYFVIVGFAGVRIVDFDLTGGDKYILVQPAYVLDRTAIVEPGATSSDFIGQPVHLVR